MSKLNAFDYYEHVWRCGRRTMRACKGVVLNAVNLFHIRNIILLFNQQSDLYLNKCESKDFICIQNLDIVIKQGYELLFSKIFLGE